MLKCASTLVGDVPFAAGTTNDFQAGKNKIAGSMEEDCFDGYNKASLVVWAIRDPGGAFAVGGSKVEGGRQAGWSRCGKRGDETVARSARAEYYMIDGRTFSSG